MEQSLVDELTRKYAPKKPFIPRCVYIGIPSHDGNWCAKMALSLIETLKLLQKANIEVIVDADPPGNGICIARNEILFRFMQTMADALFFIDADIQFEPESFLRILTCPGDITIGAYPTKSLNFQKLADLISARDPEAVSKSMNYPLNISKKQRQGGETVVEIPGFLQLDDGATGFMRIKRSVIGRLMKKTPERQYFNDLDKAQHALFNNDFVWCNERHRPIYRGEDYSFCALARKHGYKVYASMVDEFVHHGPYGFHGHWGKTLNKGKN